MKHVSILIIAVALLHIGISSAQSTQTNTAGQSSQVPFQSVCKSSSCLGSNMKACLAQAKSMKSGYWSAASACTFNFMKGMHAYANGTPFSWPVPSDPMGGI